MTFTPKHIIITGGSSGVGRALALRYAKMGYAVSIIARDESKLQTTYQALCGVVQGNDKPFMTCSADVSNYESVKRAINKCINRYGCPDIFITCAGRLDVAAFNDLPIDSFEKTIHVNYLGTVYAIKSVLPHLIARGSGQIVMIASAAALLGVFGYSSYGPSKYALRGLAESLYYELKLHNIALSAAYLPDVDTPQLRREMTQRTREMEPFFKGMNPISAEAAAAAIIKGANKKKFAITPGFDITCLWKFNSIILPFLRFYYSRVLTKFRNT